MKGVGGMTREQARIEVDMRRRTILARFMVAEEQGKPPPTQRELARAIEAPTSVDVTYRDCVALAVGGWLRRVGERWSGRAWTLTPRGRAVGWDELKALAWADWPDRPFPEHVTRAEVLGGRVLYEIGGGVRLPGGAWARVAGSGDHGAEGK